MLWLHLISLVIIPLYNSSFPQSLDSFIYSRTLSGKGFLVFHLHCLSVTCCLCKSERFFWRPTYREPWVVGSFTKFPKTNFTIIVSLLSPLHPHPLPHATPSGIGDRGIDLNPLSPLFSPNFYLFHSSFFPPPPSLVLQQNFSFWAWGFSNNPDEGLVF